MRVKNNVTYSCVHDRTRTNHFYILMSIILTQYTFSSHFSPFLKNQNLESPWTVQSVGKKPVFIINILIHMLTVNLLPNAQPLCITICTIWNLEMAMQVYPRHANNICLALSWQWIHHWLILPSDLKLFNYMRFSRLPSWQFLRKKHRDPAHAT